MMSHFQTADSGRVSEGYDLESAVFYSKKVLLSFLVQT